MGSILSHRPGGWGRYSPRLLVGLSRTHFLSQRSDSTDIEIEFLNSQGGFDEHLVKFRYLESFSLHLSLNGGFPPLHLLQYVNSWGNSLCSNQSYPNHPPSLLLRNVRLPFIPDFDLWDFTRPSQRRLLQIQLVMIRPRG